MEKILNQSVSLFQTIQKHHRHESEDNSFTFIENILNFTTSIPNSKLINVTIENLKSKTEGESISQSANVIDSSEEEIRSHAKSFFETTIIPEHLVDMNVETEIPFTEHNSFKAFIENIWPEDSEFMDNSEDISEIITQPPIIPSKETKDFAQFTEATVSLKTSMPHTTKTSGILRHLSVGENDMIVTTTTRGMEVDFSDVLNPKHISKATNYSTNYHLSTVTRSATVLADIVRPHIDFNKNVDSNIAFGLFNSTTHKSLNIMKTKEPKIVKNGTNIKISNADNFSTLSSNPGKIGEQIHQNVSASKIMIFPPKIPLSPAETHQTGARNSQIEAKSPILVEKDASDSIKYDFSSSIVLSIGISCAFALLLFVILSLWLLKRSKYHSKVYLNYELAKPRTHIMKPMRPSVLPGETIIDNMVFDETESPREPIYLDQEMNVNITPLHSKYSISMESCDSGIDNLAFTDASSSEGQRSLKTHTLTRKKETNKSRRPTPKYIARKKKLLVDSSLKVCSSDGSIFPASPSLTKCLIPPPPYSPSIKNDSKLSLSLSQPNDDSLTKNPINSISEGCDHLPSQSSTIK